jgi:transcriptional regulator with XRE-family HTH domain/KaiC/GvpD/RAD55 family RecA-like ATPase
MEKKVQISSGVPQLDHLLDGLYIGDNVVWHDDAGSLASVFCLNFIRISKELNKPIIYVSFDRSPRNLIDKLGSLANYPQMTILDCFTFGKGAGSSVFLKFYKEIEANPPCRIVPVETPRQREQVMESLYSVHAPMQGDVRLVFESLTGMADLWEKEEHVLQFYSHSCPRLYELNTIAYWILEKKAHTPRFRAQINQIAQVAVELSIKRGTTSLTILKAEKRNLENFHKPQNYWIREREITFAPEKRLGGGIDLGRRMKELRIKKGLSQTELAHLVGVTPSTISQIESNVIYPSLPGLMKMAEILSVEISSFFHGQTGRRKRVIFPAEEALEVNLGDWSADKIRANLLIPVDLETKIEPYLIEIPPGQTLSSHFFIHKGEEMGYLLSGVLQVKLNDNETYLLHAGEVICLQSEVPLEWKNIGSDSARLLWVNIR